MFCGTSSFRDLAGDDDAAAAPKTSRKKNKKRQQSKSKNPYSSRGLDKFTSVLSDLEARREKIMATTGAQGISMIRFMYSNSQDWIPIIVRLRDDGNLNNNINNNNNNNQLISATSSPKILEKVAATPTPHTAPAAPVLKKSPWWRWRSAYCMPVMMVVLLVCLVIFGRVFAICCTSIWWYLVPILQTEDGKKTRRRVSRKDYVKKISDKRLQPPPPPPVIAAAQATGTGLQMLASPRAHGNNNGKKG